MSEKSVTTFRIRNCRFRVSPKKCTKQPVGECPYNGNMAFLKCQKGKEKVIGTVSLAGVYKNCERVASEAREQAFKEIGELFEPMLDTTLYFVISKKRWRILVSPNEDSEKE